MFDVQQYQSAWDTWGKYGQQQEGLKHQTQGYSQATTSKTIGESIEKMPSFGSDFVQGMKLGYAGEQMTVAPFLSYRKAKQEKAILKMQQEVLEIQAQTYQTAAEDVIAAGHQQSAQVSYAAGQAKSSTKARQGASGVRVGAAGSAGRVLASYDLVKEVQTNQIMANALNQSFGYQRAAVDARNQALAVEYARKSISPWAAAITSFVSANMEMMSFVGSNYDDGNGGIMSKGTWQNFGSSMASMFGGGK